MNECVIRRSELDEARFGVRTVLARGVRMGDLAHLDTFCRRERAHLSIVRVDTLELQAVQQLEADGYRLMDTLLSYSRDLARQPAIAPTPDFVTRPAVRADGPAVREVARAAFTGYLGHYHADPRLPRDLCDQVYMDWAERSIPDAGSSGWMQVAERGGRVVGFVTARLNTPEDGEVVLSGVLPEARGRGVYQTFLELGVYWCQTQGARRVWFLTQVTNTIVQKVYIRLGFLLDHSEHTLHKWFE
jgi:ribosomal protein S18 acetylase RimI-like enzyme